MRCRLRGWELELLNTEETFVGSADFVSKLGSFADLPAPRHSTPSLLYLRLSFFDSLACHTSLGALLLPK